MRGINLGVPAPTGFGRRIFGFWQGGNERRDRHVLQYATEWREEANAAKSKKDKSGFGRRIFGFWQGGNERRDRRVLRYATEWREEANAAKSKKDKSGIAAILLTLCILALAGLFIISRLTAGYADLYFAGPKYDATAMVEKAADFNIACETATFNIDTNIISVNHTYAGILGYETLSGSFLTASTLKEKRSNTVLNEKLAFDTFGNFDIMGNTYEISGEPYLVIGVIDDGSEEKTAYIPAQTTAANFLAVIETEEKTITDLKSIGVNENRFHMVNLNEIAVSVQNKPWLALTGAGIILTLLLLHRTIKYIRDLIKILQQMNREMYTGELIKTAAAGQLAALTAAIAAETVALLWLIMQGAKITLHWAKYAGALNGITTPAFGGIIPNLQNLCLYSNILLAILCCALLLGIAFCHSERSEESS